ncbi:MAG: hypothetical protein KDD50_10435 [Bdellovibrionales bacterium]|nr:hypothetical protein [Bdellovibrionales bacterium]
MGGNLTNNRINGFQALGGMGGSTGNSNNEGSSGGNGSVGRFWATDADKTFSGTGSENAPSILIAEQGIVDSQVGQFETVFGVFDSGTLHPIIDSIQDASNVPSGSSLNYFVASSKEQSFSTTTWQGLSTVTGQKLDRYLKIKVVMDNQVESDPVTLSSLSINYSDGDEMEFDFISACGGVDTLNGYWSLILYLMPITLFLIMKLKILYWDSHSLRF